jgi:hypothetical protein
VGPSNLIDRIDQVRTEALSVRGINGPVSGTCELIRPFGNDQLALVPDQVNYSLSAERFTESTIAVSVSSTGRDQVVKTFPEEVKITFLVSLDNFKRVTPDLFSAVIDLTEVPGNRAKVPVKLDKIPPFVEVTRIDPPEVDFLLLKK